MSFFEKLKREMGIEIPTEKEIEEELKKPLRKERPKKLEIKVKSIEPGIKKRESKAKEDKRADPPAGGKERWFEPEGQLVVDVYQTDKDLIIQSAIAGVKPEDLDISIEAGQVLIKGSREKPKEEEKRNYFYQECYWGPFSKQIILPEEVNASKAEALMKEGILTIKMPKIERRKKRKIEIKG